MTAVSAPARTPLWRVSGIVLRLATAAGLALDAYVHADLANTYDAVGTTLTQGTLFRIEAGLAALAALVIVVSGRRAAFGLALLVAASALAVLLIYRYVNVGSIGPIPSMYEPVWFHDKTLSAWAEAVATGTAALGLALPRRPVRRAD